VGRGKCLAALPSTTRRKSPLAGRCCSGDYDKPGAEIGASLRCSRQQVCKPFDIDSRDLGSRARLDSCVNKAIANAVTKVDHPELFAVYNAKNHQPRPIIVAAVQTR
jgi:hypothetical protein